MLTDWEQRTLQRMERRLRAEDNRFTRSFEMFEFDLATGARTSTVGRLVTSVRQALAVAVLLLIPLAWLVALMSSGDLAAILKLALIPASAVLLALGFAVHPDRGVRPGRGSARGSWR